MPETTTFTLHPVGVVRSSLEQRADAPKQGCEGAPAAWVDLSPTVAAGLQGIALGDEVILITWLDRSRRDVLTVHPRDDETLPLAGVFATRSPDRPNPLGLHRVKVLEIAGNSLQVEPLEALDGTPVLDIKPVLPQSADS
jgi:tRNA-Thr(GGU) m(6)t(6)A37 methyltransferase TsaA